MDVAEFIERNWAVFSGAPLFVVIWTVIVAWTTWWAASRYWRGLVDERIALADERGRLYELKLNVSSPDEAAAKLADLERQVALDRAAITGELTMGQKAAIQQAAQPYHGRILFTAPTNNHRASALGQSLARAFLSAGWAADFTYSDTGDGLGIPRLYIIDPESMSTVEQAAMAAFDGAGIKVIAVPHHNPPADRKMLLKL